MGHESQIEPWLAHDQRSACWFHKSLASSQIEYENHRGRTHKRYAVVRSVPSLWSGKREQILLDNKRGWKSTKIRPKVKCFLLTSPLIELRRHCGITVAVGTTIADRPPHRSVRARLRIRLLRRMSGVEASIRIGMQNAGRRNSPVQDWSEAFPTHLCALAAAD